MSAPTAQAISAGRTKQTSARPIQSNAPGAAAPASMPDIQPVYTPMGPTSPHVPMPDATAGPFWLSWNTHVATGPVTAEATLAVPKWLYWAVVSIQTGTLSGALVDESVMFAFMLAAIVFCLGQIIEYGYLVQDENFEII